MFTTEKRRYNLNNQGKSLQSKESNVKYTQKSNYHCNQLILRNLRTIFCSVPPEAGTSKMNMTSTAPEDFILEEGGKLVSTERYIQGNSIFLH